MSYLQTQNSKGGNRPAPRYFVVEPGNRPRVIERASKPARHPSRPNWPGVRGLAIAAGISVAAYALLLGISYLIGQVAA